MFFRNYFCLKRFVFLLKYVHSLESQKEYCHQVWNFDPGHFLWSIFEGSLVRIWKIFVLMKCSPYNKEKYWFSANFLIPWFWCSLKPKDSRKIVKCLFFTVFVEIADLQVELWLIRAGSHLCASPDGYRAWGDNKMMSHDPGQNLNRLGATSHTLFF